VCVYIYIHIKNTRRERKISGGDCVRLIQFSPIETLYTAVNSLGDRSRTGFVIIFFSTIRRVSLLFVGRRYEVCNVLHESVPIERKICPRVYECTAARHRTDRRKTLFWKIETKNRPIQKHILRRYARAYCTCRNVQYDHFCRFPEVVEAHRCETNSPPYFILVYP